MRDRERAPTFDEVSLVFQHASSGPEERECVQSGICVLRDIVLRSSQLKPSALKFRKWLGVGKRDEIQVKQT